MATLDQVAAQIRFALENLSAQNAHHTFEDICRYLARTRICSNILPATGPVSAGGDQGRDFETYRTYLSQIGLAASPFLGLSATKPIVFACSLEKEIVGKIKSDVEKILSHGEKPEAIYFFCSVNVPVGKRHEIQEEINSKHSIKLEIMDGYAISSVLSDPDLFWVAEKFLPIPAEIYPTRRDTDWYADIFSKWKSQGSTIPSYASFVELKESARHAALTDSLKGDLGFWINQLQQFKNADVENDLKRKATYELAVVSLRGLGILTGQENDLRDYFKEISGLHDPVHLEDAAALVNYCIGAVSMNAVGLNYQELWEWKETLSATVERLSKQHPASGMMCSLLELRGYLSFKIDPEHPEIPAPAEALKWWKLLVKHVPKAPLYPLERFSDRLTEYMRFLQITPEYVEFSQKIDELLTERYGDVVAAEKCRDRAMVFYEKGSLLAAIDQLHIAKVKWFTDETLQGSLLTILFISQCYRELGLTFAGKYYALSVAHIAVNSSREDMKTFVPRALFHATECDYVHGSWINFLDLAPTALAAHERFVVHPVEAEKHDEFNRFIFHAVTIQALTERLCPDLEDFVSEKIRPLRLDDVIKELLPMSKKSWESRSEQEIWKTCQSDLSSIPLGDVGTKRVVRWAASGVEWVLSWANDHKSNAAGEQFTALLQIILADVSSVDICLLPTTVSIHIKCEAGSKLSASSRPSNAGRFWEISLPLVSAEASPNVMDIQTGIVAHATSILSEISLLPRDKILDILKVRFRDGLSSKAFVGAAYDSLYCEFVSGQTFENPDRGAHVIPKWPLFEPQLHSDIRWRDGPGPTYSPSEALQLIRNRYKNSVISIQKTLERLSTNPDFLKVVRKLRVEGWRDWHILASIASRTANYRLRLLPGACDDPKWMADNFGSLMWEKETDSSVPVPLSEYVEDKLRLAHDMNMLSVLHSLGLECRQETPDFPAVQKFLAKRYHYWTDDTVHDDPFPEASRNAE